MSAKSHFFRVLSTLDPKRDVTEAAPRPMLIAKNVVEYVFRIAGFFVLLCLIAGMTLASCPTNIYIASMPFVLGVLLCFYVALTTLGIPVFLMIAEIRNVRLRRGIGYLTVIVLLLATLYTFAESPIFDLLLTYVAKIFPEAFSCTEGLLMLDTI